MEMAKLLGYLSTACLVLLAVGMAGANEEEFPGVRNLMTPEEYRAAGLEKLSPEELESLNKWLIRYTAGDSATLRRSNEEVRKAEENLTIQANITGDFTGWTGETTFKLDNGQVWRQRIGGRFKYSGGERAVEIRKNFLGFYMMTHLESGKTVGVTRVD